MLGASNVPVSSQTWFLTKVALVGYYNGKSRLLDHMPLRP